MTSLKKTKNKFAIIAGGCVIEILFLYYRLNRTGQFNTVLKYIAISLLVFLTGAIVFFLIRNLDFSRTDFVIVIIFTAFFLITLVSAPPDLSDDIYRYIWDGKLQSQGINPYKYAPGDPELEQFHSLVLPALVNFPEIKTIYPPVTQLIFRFSFLVFAESVTGMKIIFSIFALGCCLIFYQLTVLFFNRGILSLFFCWSPLMLMETAVNGHLEIVMVFFLLLFIYFFKKGRYLFSGLAFTAAVLSKLFPVILLGPVVFWLAEKKKWKSMLQFMSAFAVSTLLLCALYGSAIVNMLKTALNYSSKWYFNNPLFYLINELLQSNKLAHLFSFSGFALLFIFLIFKKITWETRLYFIVAGFILFNPTIHPWYLISLIALLSVFYFEPALIWSGMVTVSYIVVYNFKITGIWADTIWQLIIQYLPVVLFWVYSWKARSSLLFPVVPHLGEQLPSDQP